jgi:hypothetical protein
MDDYIDMMRAFEIKKRDLKPNEETKVTIRIPPSLIDIVLENRGKQLKDIIKESKYNGDITYVSGKIRICPELLINLFKDTVAKIIKHMNSLLQEEKCHDCSTIVLAGGFAESIILQEDIRDAFKSIRLIIPDGTGLVVLKGAVIFGHRPATIEERVCRYTYGLRRCHRTSEKCKHPPTITKEGKDGIMRCENLFAINVRGGETVYLSEERPAIVYHPRYDDDTRICLSLYASEIEDPSLTTEDGCFRLGKLIIPITDTSHGRERKFKCTIIFGGTEIVVKVVDEISNEVSLLAVNCLE